MKLLNLSILTTLYAGFCMAQGYEANPIEAYIQSLEPVLGMDTMLDPFNLVAYAKTDINQTIAKYEELYNNSKDECLRGCYSYSIHLLEISYNLNCESKFNKINEEYKNNKPCYKASPDMQNILDNGNAYVDLFCAKDEESKPCSFITDIVKIPDNSTIVEKVCKTPENERKQCDKSLIQNLSAMIDAKGKLGETDKATYSSGGLSITLNTPKYDTDKIKAQLENNTCLAKIEPPKQILVKANSTNNGTESAATNIMVGHGMNTFVVLIAVALVALLF